MSSKIVGDQLGPAMSAEAHGRLCVCYLCLAYMSCICACAHMRGGGVLGCEFPIPPRFNAPMLLDMTHCGETHVSDREDWEN